MFCFISCSVDQQDYMSYLFDAQNGLVKSNESNGNKYRMFYRPIELMVAHELNSSTMNASELRNQLQGQDYFIIDIQKEKKAKDSKSDFYYAYKFEKDIFQLDGQDTIRPSLYNLEQGIDGSEQFRINIAFPVTDNDRHIVVQDRYGETSEYTFRDDDINRIPKLKM